MDNYSRHDASQDTKLRQPESSKWKYDYMWSSMGEYVLIGLCYCVTPDAMGYFTQTEDEPATFQEIAAMFFICLPMLYMQISLGKYTQNSIINMQYMIPIMKGLGYMFLVNVIISCIKCIYYIGDLLLYFLLSFQLSLPWSKCQDILNSTTYNVTEHCFDDTIAPKDADSVLAAKLFWTYIYMDNPMDNNASVLQRFVSLWISWLILFAVVNIAINGRSRIVLLLELIFGVCFLLMLICTIFTYGSSQGMAFIFTLHSENLFVFSKWAKAVTKTTKFMALGQTFHIMSGSRMTISTSADIWCTSLLVTIILSIVLFSVFSHGILGIGEVKTKFNITNYKYIFSYDISFVYVPGYLSYLNAPQIWCVTFFLGMICLILLNSTFRLLSILFSIVNHIPYMMKYRIYLLGMLCFLGAVIGSFLMPHHKFEDRVLFVHETTTFSEVLAVTIQSIFVLWVYSVQALGDDIHYITGKQPAQFWKICWYTCPLVYSTTTIYNFYKVSCSSKMISQFIILFIIASPVFCGAIIQFFVYLRRRRLIDLLQPDVEWGVPDPEERHLRHLFNPRKEVRSKMRRYKCQHKCLIGSRMHKVVCQMEATERNEIFNANYLRVKRI